VGGGHTTGRAKAVSHARDRGWSLATTRDGNGYSRISTAVPCGGHAAGSKTSLRRGLFVPIELRRRVGGLVFVTTRRAGAERNWARSPVPVANHGRLSIEIRHGFCRSADLMKTRNHRRRTGSEQYCTRATAGLLGSWAL
jgi:hypothetical protein